MDPSRSRRDRSGHIDPQYARALLARSGHTRRAGAVVLPFATRNDEDAVDSGIAFILSIVAGGAASTEANDVTLPEEDGGPFVETWAEVEFAVGNDASNPPGASREPLPRTRNDS